MASCNLAEALSLVISIYSNYPNKFMILLPHGKIKDHFSTMINRKIVFLADRKVKLLLTMFCLKPMVEAALILTIYSCGRKVGSGESFAGKRFL